VRIFSNLVLGSLITLGVASQARTRATSPYPDSADGFRQQLEDLISSRKSGDQTAFHAELDALAIPNANDWIASHFAPGDIPNLQRDYPLSLAGFLRHLTWVVENAAHLPGWEMVVKPSELPNPPAITGPEAEIPMPAQPIAVENFTYCPAHPEDPPDRSWVNSFVYLEGRFRYAGGTYPFWAEDLQQVRRPQAGPLQKGPFTVTSARLVHKVSPKYPKKARKERVEGVVRLHAIIGKDGTPRELTVLSGDPLLTDAAIKAVRQWRYLPTLLEGQPVEVDTTIDVIFALNH
jgi:TonB family protein